MASATASRGHRCSPFAALGFVRNAVLLFACFYAIASAPRVLIVTIDAVSTLPAPVPQAIIALSYVPLLLLFFSRSLLSTATGFIFKMPTAFFVDLVGLFMSLGVLMAVGRLYLKPWFEAEERSASISASSSTNSTTSSAYARIGVSNVRISSQETSSYSTATSPSATTIDAGLSRFWSSSSSVLQLPSSLYHFLRSKLLATFRTYMKTLRILNKKLPTWKICLLMNLSPIVPLHILTYGIAMSDADFYEAWISITLFNIPYGLAYTALGSSASDLSEVFQKGSAPISSDDHSPQAPTDLSVFSLGIQVFLVAAAIIATIAAGSYVKRVLDEYAKEDGVGMDELGEGRLRLIASHSGSDADEMEDTGDKLV